MTVSHEFSPVQMRRLEANRKIEDMITATLDAAHAEYMAETKAALARYNHIVYEMMTLRYKAYLETQ